jgi:hypothetical protein
MASTATGKEAVDDRDAVGDGAAPAAVVGATTLS